ncbi:MAG: DEAD/DEAH box helicase [Thermoplasmatota archaeon]
MSLAFNELPLHEATQKALEAMGFVETTPIQEQAIPPLLEGRDLIGQANTGTGKTAAFGIPLIEAARNGRRGLVLAPTRELAKQVQRELQAMGKGSPVDVICLIGGAPFHEQVRALRHHPDAMLVATPGRVVDHLGRGTLDLGDIALFVLDEADEMLSMGFADELDVIVGALPQERQTILFTATLAPHIQRLAKKTLHDPVTIQMGAGAAPDVKQCFAQVAGRDRVAAISRILQAEDPRATLLFAKTRARVEDLAKELSSIGVEALHGGMTQPLRDAVMRRFRDGQTRLLVATDVAARGLDVDEIDLVLHDELPTDADTYIHRIGRTGRAGRSGMSLVFVAPGKVHRLGMLRRAVGRLDKYEMPTDEHLKVLQAKRTAQEIMEQQPGEAAQAAYDHALAAGLDAQEIALRAIEANLAALAEMPDTAAQPKQGAGGNLEAAAVALKVGKMDQVHPGAIVGVLCNAGGLRAEDIGRIDILEKMSVVEIPEPELDRVCQNLARVRLSNRPLMPRPALDWRFKAMPRR